jgi:hypothetical protein
VQNFFIDFGTSVANNACKPLGENPVTENKNNQESFEEGEEDGTDQAIDWVASQVSTIAKAARR